MIRPMIAAAAVAMLACLTAPFVGPFGAAWAQTPADAAGSNSESDPESTTLQPDDEGASALNVYVDGNLLFMSYHEVGHMLIHQLFSDDQRAARRAAEEDADDIATWLMLPDADENQQDEEILAAIEGWVRGATTNDGVEQSPHYPDDATRAARIICYTYGLNPDLYSVLRQRFPRTVQSVDCMAEVAILKQDMQDWFGDALIPPAQPNGIVITPVYEEAGPALQEARTYLIGSGILEEAAEDISQFVNLPNDVRIVAKSCGRGRYEFTYNTRTLTITACYEAVDWLIRDARDDEQQPSDGAAAASDDELGNGGSRVEKRRRSAVAPPRRG